MNKSTTASLAKENPMPRLIHLPRILLFFISAASSAGCAFSPARGYTETDETPADISDRQVTLSCVMENADGTIVETPCPKYHTLFVVDPNGGCSDPNAGCNMIGNRPPIPK